MDIYRLHIFIYRAMRTGIATLRKIMVGSLMIG